MEPKTKEETIKDLLQVIRSSAHLIRYAEATRECDAALARLEEAVVKLSEVLQQRQIENENEKGEKP